MKKQVVILGSTGSIGVQALAVCKKLGYRVLALTAHNSIDRLEEQIREFQPRYVTVSDEAHASRLKSQVHRLPVEVRYGPKALCELAALREADVVLNAIVGIAGLRPTIAALEAGHDLALANKESLVAAGKLVIDLARRKGVRILPVDSEHSAIFQCLNGFEGRCRPRKLILTASGGPFFGKTREELRSVDLSEALNHPNWKMGAKITVDSATMMNKGLEVIEAVWLFGMQPQEIEVVVQRESILHSAVEFADRSVIAQLGTPDMRIPIQYALTYPQRVESDARPLSLTALGSLSFAKPDYETFVCLGACIQAVVKDGLYPAIVNGANEQAVKLFLAGKISFLEIGELVTRAMNELSGTMEQYRLDDVFRADRAARDFVLREAIRVDGSEKL